MSEILKIENLEKHYRNFVLAVPDLSIKAGLVVGLIGENGAGKTTLLKSILGMNRMDFGRISLFRPHVVTRDAFQIRGHIGYVPEDQILYEWMSIRETLRFHAAFYPSWDATLAGNLLQLFRLKEHLRAGELSKGMKVKLLLVLALAHRPDVLLLDEPTAGLDPLVKDELFDHFHALRKRQPGLAILISSHILSDIEDLADEIVILHDGKVVLNQTKASLLETWAVACMPDSTVWNFESSEHASSILCSAKKDGSLYLLVHAKDSASLGELAPWKSLDAELRPAKLHEIYLGLVRQKLRL